MTGQQPPILTIDQIVAIRTPESPAWSPDGTRVAYRLAGFEHGEIWLSDTMGRSRQLTSGDSPTGPPIWDGEEKLHLHPRQCRCLPGLVGRRG